MMNLACRVNGINVATDSPEWWVGGVPWWGERMVQRGVAKKFELDRDYPPGTMFLRRYTGPVLGGHSVGLDTWRLVISSHVPL
jgi:hypothetical protein